MNDALIHKCPLCGSMELNEVESICSDALNRLYYKRFGIKQPIQAKNLRYLVCGDCGVGFFDPMEFGGEGLYERLQSFDWYYMENKWEYGFAKQYLVPGSDVLEVGAGKAAFSCEVGAEHYTGLEFNDKAIERATEAGINLIKESIEKHAASGKVYDAVVSFQVLEHVPDPSSFIKACVQCLKPGGRLIIGVPAHDGFSGVSVNNILDMPPHHVTHWSGETLTSMSSLFGVEMLSKGYEPVAEYHRLWLRKTVWEARVRRMLRMQPRLLDISLLARMVSVTASLLAKVLPVSEGGFKGHTIVAVYRKLS